MILVPLAAIAPPWCHCGWSTSAATVQQQHIECVQAPEQVCSAVLGATPLKPGFSAVTLLCPWYVRIFNNRDIRLKFPEAGFPRPVRDASRFMR